MGDQKLLKRDRNRLIEWGGKFLRTVSTSPEVMRELVRAGYSLGKNRQGWDLYVRMLGGGQGKVAVEVGGDESAHKQAWARLEEFRKGGLRFAKATIAHHHPELSSFLFPRLQRGLKDDPMVAVGLFLDRYVALRDGTDMARPGSKLAGRRAAETLITRNIMTDRIEKQLAEDLELVKSLPEAETVLMPMSAIEVEEAAIAFRTWLTEWRLAAQANVKRRDHRILLGVSKPRASAGVKGRKKATEPADA